LINHEKQLKTTVPRPMQLLLGWTYLVNCCSISAFISIVLLRFSEPGIVM